MPLLSAIRSACRLNPCDGSFDVCLNSCFLTRNETLSAQIRSVSTSMVMKQLTKAWNKLDASEWPWRVPPTKISPVQHRSRAIAGPHEGPLPSLFPRANGCHSITYCNNCGMDSATRNPPLEQLTLVHEELNRQRDSTADKHRTMYQRASLLIGGATLVTGVQAARFPMAINAIENSVHKHGWCTFDAFHTVAALVFAIGATIFALIAAIQGIRAIMVETGLEIDVAKFGANLLEGPSDLYTGLWSLVRDKLEVHAGDMLRLESRRLLFTRGATMLVVSWSLAILHFATSGR